MDVIKSEKGYFISAKELYFELGVKRDFSTWIKQSIERAELEDCKDFTPFKGESTGGRPTVDYLLTRDSALTVVMMSGGQFAGSLRKKVIELYSQHDNGLAFTSKQIEALMDLSRAITLVSIQKDVEKKHYLLYNNTYTWHKHRAEILGYSKDDVIEAMRKINKKYNSMRESLVKLDANELIRVGAVDFMMAMGKTEEYATNVGSLCKSMASRMELGNIIWDDTKDNPLGINKHEIDERKACYSSAQKILE